MIKYAVGEYIAKEGATVLIREVSNYRSRKSQSYKVYIVSLSGYSTIGWMSEETLDLTQIRPITPLDKVLK